MTVLCCVTVYNNLPEESRVVFLVDSMLLGHVDLVFLVT